MRNDTDMDSKLALAVGLLGATIVAALVVLILPAVVGRHPTAEALPAPEIVTTSGKSASEAAPSFHPLPKAQRPPEALLGPAPAARGSLAMNR